MNKVSERVRRSTASTLLAGGALAAAVFVAGCTAPVEPTATPTPSASASSETPAAPLTYQPDAGAEGNLDYFNQVNTQTLGANAEADGRAFIDGLVTAGFDKAAMEVTNDTTTIGNKADSIQFSVKMGDNCLIGQNGPSVGGYHSTVATALGTGKCLVGNTRAIDW